MESKKLILPERVERETLRRARQLVTVNLVVMRSEDGENWEPVPPEEVPDWVKDANVIREISEGNACQAPGESTWYGAIHASDGGTTH